MKHGSLKVLISMGAFLASTSFADIQATPAELALVKKIGQDHLSVLNTFQGPGNLMGFVLQSDQGSQPILMYVDDQARYAVYGTIIGADGTNLTENDTEKYIKKYTAMKIADNLAETTAVKEGRDDAKYKIIVLADPSCSACHFAYNEMKPFIDKGELQVQWIFVYFVQPDSKGQAAAIMTAKHPGLAMRENEDKFNSQKELGGIKPMKDIPKTTLDELEGNMKFMHDTGISSTPTIIYYGADGQLEFTAGAPRNMAEFLKTEAPGAASTATTPVTTPDWWSKFMARVKQDN